MCSKYLGATVLFAHLVAGPVAARAGDEEQPTVRSALGAN